MIKAKEFYEDISKEWESKKSELPWDGENKLWTTWIKGNLYAKGKDLKFDVELGKLSGNRGNGEYLVDLCWWKEENNQYWLELIVESEWSADAGEIEHDFYKLIDIKSYLKVWICSWGDRQFEERKKLLSKYVTQARFKLPEEEYLIMNLPENKESNYKDLFIINGFWMNNAGESTNLPNVEIRR